MKTKGRLLLLGVMIVSMLFVMASGGSNSSSGGSGGGGSARTCEYKYSDGRVCGNRCTDHPSLCNRHYDELYSTYHDLTGK